MKAIEPNLKLVVDAIHSDMVPPDGENRLKMQISKNVIPKTDKKVAISGDFSALSAVKIDEKSAGINPPSPLSLSSSVRDNKKCLVDTVVGLPNLTKRFSQSEKEGKKITPKRKKKSVKEVRNELELRSLTPITHFFQKETERKENDLQND